MILEGIAGSALGGLLRLAPEVIKTLDRKNERKHELSMFDKQLKADELRTKHEILQSETEGQIKLDAAGMEALITSIRSQGEKTGFRLVDAISASVRPVLTYWWAVILYTAVLGARFYLLTSTQMPAADALVQLWGPNEQSLVSSIFTFWFLDRVIKKRPI